MSLTTRPKRPLQPTGAGSGDVVDGGSVGVTMVSWPRTPAQWDAWQRRRDRMRIAIGRWAAHKALATPGLSAAEQEELAKEYFRTVLKALELTRADDERLRVENTRARVRTPKRRAVGWIDKRGG